MADAADESGLRDSLVTHDLHDSLASYGDRAVVEGLGTADAVERLGKHLLTVARRMRHPKSADNLLHTVEAINQAVMALGDDFAEDQVVTPPQVLKGVLPETGLARALPAHPHVPLTASELLVNGNGEPGFGTVLQGEVDCAVNVDLICAFVGFTGLSALRQHLAGVVQRGGRLRVITSTYLGATSAKAIDELVGMGAEVKINYQGHATKLHAKAWYFERGHGIDTAMVGSSNMSDAAFFTGLEWNVRLSQSDSPNVLNRVRQTFESYWHDSQYESYDASQQGRLIAALAQAKGTGGAKIAGASMAISQGEADLAAAYALTSLRAKPHQQVVLDRLALQREAFDEHRHLVVAATGTGKTVIAALDYARLCVASKPRPRLLFVAHRKQILEQALSTFRFALKDPNFGEILAGGSALAHDTHVFAMVQTLHQRLTDIAHDAYDVVYIDEAHHGTAQTWRDVIDHFQPQELIGLTATPERTDGGSVADLFGGVYTTELRLWEAISDQLLCPFEYLGIDDGTDLTSVAWHGGSYAVGELSEVLTRDDIQLRSVVRAINAWVEAPSRMRALGFCVSVEHAQFMAEQFSALGIKAEHLSGQHTPEERNATLDRLRRRKINAVFSVDVLGEGVDVPVVDTLLLLRPTQSPVVFAQQLGRGLRLSPGKSSCLVLDFIGQHRAEYRLEERYRALLDPSQGNFKEQIQAGFPFLAPGCTITLEKVAQERVLKALRATTKPLGLKAMAKELRALESPTLEAFLKATGRSLGEFYNADGRKMSWTRLRREAGVLTPIADAENSAAESALLRRSSYFQHVTDPQRTGQWFDWLTDPQAPNVTALSVSEQLALNQLAHILDVSAPGLQDAVDIIWSHAAVRDELAQMLTLTSGRLDTMTQPMPGLEDLPLRAHARYTRAEVLAAIGASPIEKPRTHREGVYFSPHNRIQLMFVTLQKDAKQFSSTVQYRDHALSPTHFHWESPNNWRQDGDAMRRCIGQGPDGSVHRLLFVREQASGAVEGTFRCFGQVDVDGPLTGERPVAVTWKLRQPLPELLFEAAALLAG